MGVGRKVEASLLRLFTVATEKMSSLKSTLDSAKEAAAVPASADARESSSDEFAAGQLVVLQNYVTLTHYNGQRGKRSAVLANAIQNKEYANDDLDAELDAEAGAGWGDDDLLGGGDQGSDGDAFKDAQIDDDDLDGGDAGGGWGIDELDLPESPGQAQALAGGKGSKSSAFLPPSPGDSAVAMWLSNANAAGCTPET